MLHFILVSIALHARARSNALRDWGSKVWNFLNIGYENQASRASILNQFQQSCIALYTAKRSKNVCENQIQKLLFSFYHEALWQIGCTVRFVIKICCSSHFNSSDTAERLWHESSFVALHTRRIVDTILLTCLCCTLCLWFWNLRCYGHRPSFPAYSVFC